MSLRKQDFLFIIFFFLIGILSRIFLIEHFQSHWDGPQYSLGVLHYDLTQETPAPPGYPLYIFMGRIFYTFFQDPHFSLLMVSVLFSGIGAVLFYLFGKRLANQSVGIISSLLFLSAPTIYFFGLTTYAYGVIPTLATMLALCVYEIVIQKKNQGIVLGVVCAFALGVRPQEALMLLPLFVLGIYYLPRKQKIISVITLIVGLSLWIIPYFFIVGGIGKFLFQFSSFAHHGAFTPITIHNSLTYASRMAKDLFLTFTISTIFLFYYFYKLFFLFKKKIPFKKMLIDKKNQFFFFWFTPSSLVNLLVRSDHAGYQMTYLSCLLFFIALAEYKLFKKRKALLIGIVLCGVLFNLFWFFRDRDPYFKGPYIPTSFHYSEIRKNDIKLGAKVLYIQHHFSPKTTLLITSPDPWRPLMYHLKPFTIYSPAALVTTEKQFKDVMRMSKNWKREEKIVTTRKLRVPPHITTIVFTDDDAYRWIKNTKKQIILLPGNSRLIVIHVSSDNKLIYGFHTVSIQ